MNKNLITMLNKSMMKLPTPTNISYWWNFGSLLGLFLLIQILSGFFLSMHYTPHIYHAFNSIIHINQNVMLGWLIHNIHINGASMFFICIYMHIGRNLYYNSFKLINTWMIGVSIYLISMMTAFLGYVLPWGQMSFWGATVITNLISTIPYIGNLLVQWIWGGFSINNATLNRFYSIHFILPFIMLMMIILHLFFLHSSGSSNPLGTFSDLSKIPFHIYFTIKDIFGFTMFMMMFWIIILEYPYFFSDPDNFTPANPLLTPIHIQPEWYFLFAYAILRSIPNKLGGVIALLLSIMILYIFPLINIKMKFNSLSFYPFNQMLFWMFMNIFILLTWTGSQMIEYPFNLISQFMSIMYFSYLPTTMIMMNIWKFLIFQKKN
uniref:Cytochrome b n=1 Tax=Acropyga kinomurai TaxID=602213 RepID=A0A6G5NIL9_9HYME|nr:cytochrome b [Acropyga kinomurai]QBG38625.1 cytochrome b [Acropyga kinomurai]